jgi:YD repeat-containing protein
LRSRTSVSLFRWAILTVLLVALLESAVIALVQTAPIHYGYDELGRLVVVVDQTGNAAIYSYDAVGNLLAIERVDPTQIPGPVAITAFTPKQGTVGTSVSIFGKGFSETASQNSVTFNGTLATIASAAPNRLIVTVPAGATTGPIAVTTPAGSATSATSFTVTSTGGAPTIASFTPALAAPGSTISITGTNFESIPTSNRLTANVTGARVLTATPTTIGMQVPGATASGRLTVATVGGSGTSANDLFIPPTPYTTTDIGFTGRMALGEAKVVTLGTAGQIALVVFDAAAGQRVGLGMSDVTIAQTTVTILGPRGASVATATVGTSGGAIPLATMPMTGTYTVLVDPTGTNTGSMTLTAGGPDLLAVSVSGPTGPVLRNLNGTWTFPVTFAIRNNGSTTANGQWWDGVVLSPDTVLSYPADPGVGGVLHLTSEPIAAGATYTRTITATVPASVVPGAYYLIMGADSNVELAETSETNNVVVSTAQVTLSATVNAADLVAVSVTGPGTPVLRNTNGTWVFPLSFTIRNDGAVTASGQWWDGVIISADTIPNYPADPGIGGILHTTSEPVAPGASYTRNIIATVPSSLAPGTYYLILGVDSNVELAETVETNNTVVSMPVTLSATVDKPDLVVTSIIAPTTPILRNLNGTWTFPLSWTIQNAGGATANGQWWDGVIISLDTIPSWPADPGVAGTLHAWNDPIAPYASYTRNVTAVAPASLSPGTYYLLGGADDNQELVESNESNNRIISAPVTLSAQYQAPDLVVTQVTGPSSPVTRNGNGTWTVQLTWTMQNNGNLTAQPGWWDSVFLSADTVWNSGDVEIGWANRTTAVAPGVNYTATFTATVPSSVTPGTYYLVGVADRWSQIAEFSETNNQLAPITVTLNP